MPGPESVRGYLDAVEAQIRWKRARTVAARELETHLEDQQEEFLAEGHPPEEAERLAVEDMGDPVAVGADLDPAIASVRAVRLSRVMRSTS